MGLLHRLELVWSNLELVCKFVQSFHTAPFHSFVAAAALFVVESYAQQVEQRQKDAIAQAKDLAISSRFRHQLTDSMKASEKSHEAIRLFSLEQQNLAKADQIFLVLKNNQWEKKNNTFMFYEDAPLQQFNALYKEILALNSQCSRSKNGPKKR